LDDKPEYDALSYFWDNQIPDKVIHISVDGNDNPKKLLVTANCGDAIRALRNCLWWKSPYRIWVDAICIDQSNVEEKNSQVNMMGDIYRNAYIVRIWLGLSTDDS
ncbi:heterokaryon incompatibility, partial [Phaeosphaeriaceae sp. PMI808]